MLYHEVIVFLILSFPQSNRSLLLTFSREYLKGEGDVTKHLNFLGYSVTHSQVFTQETISKPPICPAPNRRFRVILSERHLKTKFIYLVPIFDLVVFNIYYITAITLFLSLMASSTSYG